MGRMYPNKIQNMFAVPILPSRELVGFVINRTMFKNFSIANGNVVYLVGQINNFHTPALITMKTIGIVFILTMGIATLSPESTAAQTTTKWLDLTRLTNYPDSCTTDGRLDLDDAKKARNRLKNRFTLPVNITPMTLEQIRATEPLETKTREMERDGRKFTLYEVQNVDNKYEKLGVSVVGYVKKAFAAGRGESCNCGAREDNQIDAHIELVLYPNEAINETKETFIVEVTERSRRLAAAGLLASNIGTDWNSNVLNDKLVGRWVKFTGWLFYDNDHVSGSWQSDKGDTFGETNWRATAWEVHPVMGIEVLPGRPSDIPMKKP